MDIRDCSCLDQASMIEDSKLKKKVESTRKVMIQKRLQQYLCYE